VAFVLLGGVLAVALLGRLLLEQRLAFGPTPTITRTPANTDTPTADFRATINSAESKTQVAYRATEEQRNSTPTPDSMATPTAADTLSATPDQSVPSATATETPTPTPSEAPNENTPTPITTVFIPNVGNSGVDTPTPIPGVGIETPTPPANEATQTAVADATAMALLFTPTPVPTDTETPVPTVTPTQPVVDVPPVATLQAVTKATVPVYAGPSVLYPQINTLPQGLRVRLEGRSLSGEWVRVCCVNNVDGWVRQYFFTIADNTAPAGAPPDAKANDVRWLALQQSNAAPLSPLPVATEIPSTDYPLFRRDAASTARVTTQFRTPIGYGWPPNNQSTAGAGFSSPPVVVGSLVIAASADLHLYAFDKEFGNQRFKINLGTFVEYTPAVQDPYIYAIDRGGEIIALRDTGAADAIVWRRPLGVSPSAAMNIRGDTIFVPGVDHTLYALHRLDNGRERWRFSAAQGQRMQHPTIGDQLVYVGDAQLSAVDVYSGTVIWSDSAVNWVTAPPVYTRPGINGLAEVYAVDSTGVIHALDANTGTPFWRKETGDRPTALAVDDTKIYAAGPGFVLARDRRTGDPLWRIPFGDIGTQGGPIVGNGRILVADINGSVQILDALTGAVVGGLPINETLAGPPAVSDGWIFLAARNGRLYGMKEGN